MLLGFLSFVFVGYTLRSEASLSSLLEIDTGNIIDTEIMYREALAFKRSQYGEHHVESLSAMANLAYLLRVQSIHDEAEDLLKRVFEGYKKKMGPNHPHTLTSMNNLAGIFKVSERICLCIYTCRRTCSYTRIPIC